MLPYFDALHGSCGARRAGGVRVVHVDVVDRPRHAGVSKYGWSTALRRHPRSRGASGGDQAPSQAARASEVAGAAATLPVPVPSPRKGRLPMIANLLKRSRRARCTRSSSTASTTVVLIGLLGQLLFTARFIVQWIASERAGRAWCRSRSGSSRGRRASSSSATRSTGRTPVFIIGQAWARLIYMRNLMLIASRSARPRR